MQATPQIRTVKRVLFCLALAPCAFLAHAIQNNALGMEPEAFLQQHTGIWTLNFLILTLCITPLRSITQWHWLTRLRGMFGLFTFFYALLHLLSFTGFNHEFEVNAIARDILKRPFILFGFAAFILLLPLALTSNTYAVRRMGGKRWQELHRNIYLISLLALLHFLLQSSLETLYLPLSYTTVLVFLLGWRIKERKRKAIPVPPVSNAKPLRFFKQKPD